jgi:hypothetical protein
MSGNELHKQRLNSSRRLHDSSLFAGITGSGDLE